MGRAGEIRTSGESPEHIFLSTPDDRLTPELQSAYDWHSRLLPHRLAHRDVSELLSDESFVIRDIVAAEVAGEPAVELRYERLSGHERGHMTFNPRRSWAVLEFQKTQTYQKSPEHSQAFRYTYAEGAGERPVIAGLQFNRTTDDHAGSYAGETEVTSVSFEQPDASVFRSPQERK